MAKSTSSPVLYATETRMFRGKTFEAGQKFEGVDCSEAELKDWIAKGFLATAPEAPPEKTEEPKS